MKYKTNQEKKNGGREEFLFTKLKIPCAGPEFRSSNMKFQCLSKSKNFEFSILSSDFHFYVSFKRYNKKIMNHIVFL